MQPTSRDQTSVTRAKKLARAFLVQPKARINSPPMNNDQNIGAIALGLLAMSLGCVCL